jgi:chemotaxis protein MotA
MKHFEFSTVIGILATLILLSVAIIMSGSNLNDFIDQSSIIIVLCGTLSITIACFSLTEFLKSFWLIMKMSITIPVNPDEVAVMMLKIAEFSYKYGVLELDKQKSLKPNSKLYQKGMTLLTDGENIENLDRIMTQEVMTIQESYNTMISILKKAAEIAPAMGLVGTLIGLVQMLSSLNDIKMIGPAMAVALLTTFYGAIMAYVILFPLAAKLERHAKIELINAQLLLKSLSSMSSKENPRYLETTLNSILPIDKKIIYYKDII